jgi:hypothetical protein
MKLALHLLIAFSCSLAAPSSLHANFSDNPDLVETSATHAKLRAKIRAKSGTSDITEAAGEAGDNVISQHLNESSSDGCNLNVGNVLIDDGVHNPPDEVIVIIEGDIIQSNNCR